MIISETPTHKAQTDASGTLSNPIITTITKRAFMQRFTQTERIALRASVDPIVVDIYEDLKLSRYVDLKNSDVSASLDYLIAQSLITTTRKAELLINGTSDEAI